MATEGLLAGVGSDVTLEEPRPGEGLVADVAFIGQSVGSQMHFHGAGGLVELTTCRAAVALLGLVAFG